MRNKSNLLAVSFMLISQFSLAQEVFPDDVQDVPLSHSSVILILLGSMVCFLFFKQGVQKFKTKHKKSTS